MDMFSVVLFVYHCGVIVAYVSITTAFIIGMISAVAVLWCYCGVGLAARTKVSEREQILGQRREVWATLDVHPLVQCTVHPYTPLNRLVHPYTPWYTLAPPLNTLVHTPWYTLV